MIKPTDYIMSNVKVVFETSSVYNMFMFNKKTKRY